MPAKRKKSNEPRKTTKGKGRNYRTVKEGAGMTKKGVKEYRKKNPGSKLKTAVTGKVNVESHFALDQKAGLVKEVRLQDVDGNVKQIKHKTWQRKKSHHAGKVT